MLLYLKLYSNKMEANKNYLRKMVLDTTKASFTNELCQNLCAIIHT